MRFRNWVWDGAKGKEEGEDSTDFQFRPKKYYSLRMKANFTLTNLDQDYLPIYHLSASRK